MKIGNTSINDRYVWCRVYGHNWDTVGINLDDRHFIIEELGCMNCETTRTSRVARGTGHVRSRSYSYPDNYHVEGGIDKDQKGKMRLKILGTRRS
ncbi:hypothetical protein SEA_POKYPUPPY_81 [Gordonia phage PokyPuppy]|nr:hypothetical protein SEA_POKYPUPPY_81 [Gordonia phage PokyPuppy]